MDTRCRSSLSTLLVLSILLSLMAALRAPGLAIAQDDATPLQLAAPPLREPAWHYSGTITVRDDAATLAGVLTAINGLDPAVATDRFALAGDITLAETATTERTTTWSGEGVLTVYAHETPLASGNPTPDPAAGLPLATFAASLDLSRITDDAGQGVITGRLDLTQTTAHTFTLDGAAYRFGSLDVALVASMTGGVTDDADRLAIFGTAAVSARPARTTDSGPATPTATLSPCEELAGWITATSERLTIAAEQRAILLSGEALAVADIEAALANVTTLLAAQQATPPPADAATAASLVLSTLTTDARGLQLILSATETGDQAALDQAAAILTDADNLSARAVSTLAEITPDCDAAG